MAHLLPEALSDLAAAFATECGVTRGTPGFAVAVAERGRPVLLQAFGTRDVATGQPLTPTSNFRLASVSKQFTAAAVLVLQQGGRLSLSDPARRYLPELPAWANGITLAHLLGHTSGVPDYEQLMPPGQTAQVSDAGVLALVAGGEPLARPGACYHYSNSAYALLAVIVERVAGRGFGAFLGEHVFAPAGMHRTVAHVEGETTVAERAFGHSPGPEGTFVRTDQSPTSAVLGDGGIYSSLTDLLAWDHALHTCSVLSPASLALALTPGRLEDGSPTHYGLGLRTPSPDLHFHNGDSIGFRSKLLRIPSRRLVVALLMNRPDLPFDAWTGRVIEVVGP